VNMHVLKVLAGDDGHGNTADLLAGLQAVLDSGKPGVVNLSLVYYSFLEPMQALLEKLAQAGYLVVSAAGNHGDPWPEDDRITYPAAYASVKAIGALDGVKDLAGFSNKGAELAVVAPGVDIVSTMLAGSVTWTRGRAASFIFRTAPFKNAPLQNATGRLFDAKYGAKEFFTPAAAGAIAIVIRDSRVPYDQAVANAIAAGAVGVIVQNTSPDNILIDGLNNPPANGIPVVGVTGADGNALKSQAVAQSGSLDITLEVFAADYGTMSGTSMATPFAASAVALLHANRRDLPYSIIWQAIHATADDMGLPGPDDSFGYGRVNVDAAASYLANHYPVPTRGRAVRH
jgi:serine protease